MFKVNGKYSEALFTIDMVEPECIVQVINYLNLPLATDTNPVLMPDTHAGKGCVVGFTAKVQSKVIPNLVGVDIGCGMLAAKTNIHAESIESLLPIIDKSIRDSIPLGRNVHSKLTKPDLTFYDTNPFVELTKKVAQDLDYMILSLGTLGGGNHFIEFGKDSQDILWVVIHSGSRNLGKRVCEYHQKQAANIEDEEEYRQEKQHIIKHSSKQDIQNKLQALKAKYQKIKNLEWLSGVKLDAYLQDMYVAQNYASINRKLMMEIILDILYRYKPSHMDNQFILRKNIEFIETIHNYIDPNDHIIRKGAVRSYIGEKFIIPLNMKDGFLLCEGKSNPEWNYSAPHGAGRIMSRSQAKANIAFKNFQESMNGIFSTSISEQTLDESPMAYKNKELIIGAIEPTATIIEEIKPIYNLKG